MELVPFVESMAAIFILYCIPGIIATFSLLKGDFVGRISKLGLGLTVGLMAVPFLASMEFSFLNIPFSFNLLLANSALAYVVSLTAFYFTHNHIAVAPHKHAARKLKAAKESAGSAEKWWALVKAYWPVALLLACMAIGFWARYSTSNVPNFFEFDPYYYDRVSQLLVTHGTVPIATQDVYYPLVRSMRSYPLLQFVTSSWMVTGSAVAGYPVTTAYVEAVSQLYPPIFGVLMAFLSYVFLKTVFRFTHPDESGAPVNDKLLGIDSSEYIAVVGAAVMAFIPQLVTKMAAGVSSLQPFGLFAALFVFVCFALALHFKSIRFAILTGFAIACGILGSAHGLWPNLVVAAFIIIIGLLDYINSYLDTRKLSIYLIPVVSGLLAGIALVAYQNAGIPPLSALVSQLITICSGTILAMTGAGVGLLVLYLVQNYGEPRFSFGGRLQNKGLVLLILAILVIAMFFTVPFFSRAVGNALSTAGFAVTGSSLSKTIQEEAPTTSADYFSSFGAIDPNLTLMVTAAMIALAGVSSLYSKGHKNAAYLCVAVILVFVFLNGALAVVMQGFANLFFSQNSVLSSFIAQSGVFTDMLVVILVLGLDSVITGEQRDELILLSLFIFPVAFIGLNKLKYLVHLSLVLALCLPVLLAVGKSAIDKLDVFFKVASDRRFIYAGTMVLVLLFGVFIVYTEATTINSSMLSLGYSRISSDWMDTYAWMQSTPSMATATCEATYGYDCRVLSWWDYGHWTTFFGGKQSVLRPGNIAPQFDQEVAKAYVDGNMSDMLYRLGTTT